MSRRSRIAFMLFEGATVGLQVGLLTYASDVLFVLAMLALCSVVAWRAIGRTYDHAFRDGVLAERKHSVHRPAVRS